MKILMYIIYYIYITTTFDWSTDLFDPIQKLVDLRKYYDNEILDSWNLTKFLEFTWITLELDITIFIVRILLYTYDQ